MGESAGKSSKDLKVVASDSVGGSRVGTPRAWIAVAAFIFAIGAIGSVFAGISVAQNASQKSHEAFAASSSEVASELQLAIRLEEDLVLDTSVFISSNPNATSVQFAQWANSVDALVRYPELELIGRAVFVPAAGLPAFAAQAAIDSGGTFQVSPPGNRPFYCLIAGEVARGVAIPTNVDLCAVPGFGTALLPVRDSGRSAYVPLKVGNATWLAIGTPVYQGGVTPTTVAGRQAGFLGLVGTAVEPKVLLDRALQGHPGTAVTFGYDAYSSHAVFSSSKAPSGAQSMTISLHNGWNVTTFEVVANGGVFGNRSALGLLLGGIILSLILALLLFVLSTSRARALRLVSQLRASQEALVRQERLSAVGEMATVIGHELRNPLEAVVNLLFLARNGLTDHDTPEVDGYLDRIERETNRAATLCEDLTAHMRERPPVIAPLDLGALVAQVLESTPPPPGIEVAVEGLGVEVRADRAQLVQMLTNLITNAYQAMPDGGLVRVTETESDGFVEIAVEDSGVGIDPAVAERLLEPFVTTKPTGTGLGLAVVNHFAEGHNGTVFIENGPGGGARVTIRLPHTPTEATQ